MAVFQRRVIFTLVSVLFLSLALLVAPTSAQEAGETAEAPKGKSDGKEEAVKLEVKDRRDRITTRTLAKGTSFETTYQIRDSRNPGPTVFLVGGCHGDEPAGAVAAQQIQKWPLLRGKLVSLPRANEPGLKVESRYIPDVPKAERDLNRNYGKQQRGDQAKRIWTLLKKHEPDWVIDLHEGFDFHVKNSKSVGSSVIAVDDEKARTAATLMVEAANTCILGKDKRFTLLKNPIKGSLARAAHDELGISSMIVETTTKGQSLPFRVRQQRIMVHTLFAHLGLLPDSLGINCMTTDAAEVKVQHRVALYDSTGSAGQGVPRTESILRARDGIELERVCATDIRDGALAQFDVVIFSGGSGSGQSKALGDSGRRAVVEFTNAGGVYIGICAGAYLACSGFSWGLGILDAKTKSSRWRRGVGRVDLELTKAGDEVFDGKNKVHVHYANGPILEPHEQQAVPDFEVLAHFRSELAKNDTPKGIMINSPAIVRGRFGNGWVYAISPHPELTEGRRHYLADAIQWAHNELKAEQAKKRREAADTKGEGE